MKYRVLDGTTRAEAAKAAGLDTIRARIEDVEIDVEIADLDYMGNVPDRGSVERMAAGWSADLCIPIQVEPIPD